MIKLDMIPHNLDEVGKYSRIAIGVILFIAGIIGLGRGFLILAGIVLVVEGVLGFGLTPFVMEKFLKKSGPTSTPPKP